MSTPLVCVNQNCSVIITLAQWGWLTRERKVGRASLYPATCSPSQRDTPPTNDHLLTLKLLQTCVFLSSAEHKDILRTIGTLAPLISIVFFFYYGSQCC